MITYEELNTQNHEITELSNVLAFLLKDRSMCDTGTCCELFYRYMKKVQSHIDVVDKNLYGKLLASPDIKVNNAARNFMSGGHEIKHIFSEYKKKWCSRSGEELHVGKDYEMFLKDTDDLFGLVLSRIQHETERLYPLLRKVTGDNQDAA